MLLVAVVVLAGTWALSDATPKQRSTPRVSSDSDDGMDIMIVPTQSMPGGIEIGNGLSVFPY